MKSGVFELTIAGFILQLNGLKYSKGLIIPETYAPLMNPFMESVSDPYKEKTKTYFGNNPKLKLTLKERSHINPSHGGAICLYQTRVWSLWKDPDGRLIFKSSQYTPTTTIIIDPGFSTGEVFWDRGASSSVRGFPLESVDIRLFSNWLSEYGDFILHASGVSSSGMGLCFAGPSGAGKSTLAAQLSRNQNLSILGEDNLIIRYLNEAFWVFGSPWHLNPAMCSPQGVPLQKLFFLTRGAERGIKRISPIEGITRLLQTAFIPYYRPECVEKILGNLSRLAEQVPFYSLSYGLGEDVWEMLEVA